MAAPSSDAQSQLLEPGLKSGHCPDGVAEAFLDRIEAPDVVTYVVALWIAAQAANMVEEQQTLAAWVTSNMSFLPPSAISRIPHAVLNWEDQVKGAGGGGGSS